MYIERVLPEIQVDRDGRSAASGLRLSACGISATVAWADLTSQASAVSRRDFEDLILADEKGDVRWQRETSTPRIGNLSELLGAPDDSASWSSFRWRAQVTAPAPSDRKHLRSTALLKPVNVGGVSSLLLVQSVTIPPDTLASSGKGTGQEPRHLYVAGLVSGDGLRQQAMQIPIAWIVFFSVPVALLLLALPFVKLATLAAKERFSFVDVLAMLLATIAAVGLGAIVPFATMSTTATDRVLDAFADRIEGGLARETAKVLAFAEAILSRPFEGEGALSLRACAARGSGLITRHGKADSRECELWQALERASPDLDLDVVIWLNDKGQQLRKWTTKAQITGRTSHRSFDHFRDLVASRLWSLEPDTGRPPVNSRRFTIDPLRAPTTSELGVVFAMPLTDTEENAFNAAARLSPPQRVFFALNVRPQSVVDSVVPPGYGFAIIAPGGKVLFHSEESLSLEENFFEEVGSPKDVRERARSRRLVRWNGDYHGRPHRLRMEPISSLEGSPWLIVTFQEMTPMLSAMVLQQSGTLRLGTLSLLLLALIAIGYMLYSKIRRRRVRDLTQDILMPSPNARRAWCLIALAGIEVLALLATWMPFGRDRLDVLYATFVVIPMTTLVVTLVVRKWSAGESPKKQGLSERVLSSSELGVLIMVISALPAIGFARIVQTVHDSQSQQRWYEVVQQRWSEREGRVRERISGPNYSPETSRLLANGFARPTATPDARPLFSYLSILPEQERPIPPDPEAFVRRLLAWNPMSSRDDESRATALRRVTSIPRDAADAVEPAGNVSSITLALGFTILSGFLAAAYWARNKLLPPGAMAAPNLADALEKVSKSGNEIVLLVGPPRSRKDDAVVRAVRKLAHEEPVEHIPLLDKVVDDGFIQQTLGRVDAAVKARVAPEGYQGPVWIHVSNLEAQLVDETTRTQVLRLLEKLLDVRGDQPARALVVTSSIDPIAHFRELFLAERQGIYRDAVPEVSLGRSTLLLSRFRRCYAPIGPSKKRTHGSRTLWARWWSYEPHEWRKTLAIELDGYRPFVQIRDELRTAWNSKAPDGVPFDDLVRAVRVRTAASYELLWASCTRSEKLVLIQLAQEGFVPSQSWDVVAPLVAKGLVVQEPVLAIFNHTFRDFLLGIERRAVVQAWEQMEGSGLWVVAGRLIGSSLVAGGLFYLTTQDFSVQSLLPIVSGTGLFGLPLVRTFVSRLSAKADAHVSV
jgi:hypothetical protein